MRKEKSIAQHIQKVLRGQASPQEFNAVNDWYDHQEEDELLIQDFKGRTKSLIRKELFNKIQRGRISNAPNSGNRNFKRLFGIAASVVMVIGLGFVLSELTQKPKVDFSDKIAFQKVENGVGMVKKIKLPDGSRIQLFHNTTIEFDRDFSNNRFVKLEGEAFFEVVANPELPFRVQTDGLTTEVLGTSFSIKTAGLEETKVSVKTGKVSVSDAQTNFELHKDQQLIYSIGAGTVQQITNRDLVFGWAEDKIVFENSDLFNLVKVLDAWYGIQIEHNLSPNNTCRISGTYLNMSLENLLQAIQYSLPMTYQIDAKKVNIQFKNCN
ncbi:FecR family protein [Rhodonellum sp.]|uniref:FecR family protein n=1 Tax=Rhodonellum sp. TaxID=2231180 RepID=UPI0027157629|nr:FecR domain-containing protein [Rhodonellum sp.]MDO9553348.1 FecR domain-containing protein [Rhodonellum sp.]